MEITITAIPDIELFVSGAEATFRNMVDSEMRRGLHVESLVVGNELKYLTSTWNHDPGFTVETSHSGDEFSVKVTTDDEIFYYIDQGTSVRYATMTEDFTPKTKPGSLRSGRGSGGLSYVDKRVPRDGIVARNFMRTLKEKREKPFNENLSRRFYKSIDRWWARMFGG